MNFLNRPWRVTRVNCYPYQIVDANQNLVAEVYDLSIAKYIVQVLNDAYYNSKEWEHE
jgi:hypothetical protein